MSCAPVIAPPDTIPLRYMTDLNPSVDFSEMDEDTEVTFLPMDRVKSGYFIPNTDRLSKLASSYNAFEDGDIVLAKVTPCFENGNIAITENLANGKGFGSSELFVIRATEIERRFLFYCLQSEPFKQEGEASMTGAGGLKRISSDVLRQHRVRAFPRQTQRRIASYLDRETARLDALVAEKERMLVLLEQKRAGLISRAVTRGLNPRASTKPSGLDWLGDIPSHWGLERSKRYFIERDERSVTGDEEMLTVSHITGVTPRSEKDVNMFEADSNEGYKLVSPEQLVINTLWAWMGAMGVARHEGIVSPAYHVYRIAQGMLPAYVDCLVRIPAFKAEVIRFSKGVWSSRLRLYPEGLHQVWIPVPPLNEQIEIVAYLKGQQQRTAVLEATLRESIGLLKERRSALITAAVTGKISPNELNS
jgi:type I restriction enzyme S subunit